MIRKGLVLIIILGIGLESIAQGRIKEIAGEVVSNNLSIQSLALQNQVRELEDKGKLIPGDPEIAAAYMWGSPSFIGNKTNINANQKFKFPTYYARQKELNKLSAGLYTESLELEVNLVLFEILDILVDMAYLDERQSMLNGRLGRLRQIHELALQKLTFGETNRIEVEKAALLVDTYSQDLLLIESGKKLLLMRLTGLNAGKPLVSRPVLFSDFQKLFNSAEFVDPLSDNPAIGIAEMNSRIAEADVELAKTAYLPDLHVGYVREAINGEKLAGVEAGISIPLWGKPNQVKRAKFSRDLSALRLAHTGQLIQNEWDKLDEMSRQSLEIKTNLETSLSSMNSRDLLEKSWQLGEISLLDYLKELPFYYGVEDRAAEAGMQYYKSLVNRNKYHLKGMMGM